MDHYRRERRHRNYAADQQRRSDDQSDEFSPERVLIGRERLAIMARVIRRLPRQQRRVVILHRLHGLTYSRIAEQTQSSETTVRRQVAEAIEKIQAVLTTAAHRKTSRRSRP